MSPISVRATFVEPVARQVDWKARSCHYRARRLWFSSSWSLHLELRRCALSPTSPCNRTIEEAIKSLWMLWRSAFVNQHEIGANLSYSGRRLLSLHTWLGWIWWYLLSTSDWGCFQQIAGQLVRLGKLHCALVGHRQKLLWFCALRLLSVTDGDPTCL